MQLCVALDMESRAQNLALLDKLSSFEIWVKVGLRSFIRDGKEFLEQIKAINPRFKIFLDLKLYDIPNTMRTAVEECNHLGIDLLTIHASAGVEAMRAVTSLGGDKPLIFAVTALTSFDDPSFVPVYNAPIQTHAQTLALLAQEGGCDGVVCSVFESLHIKNTTSLLTLTPGIRLDLQHTQDQKRVATPRNAKEALADFIVVGRPIYNDANPAKIAQQILDEIAQ
ncbi:orotidine 5'-phosphate decarboxylase [Helicobacter enhydrae]|uniref:Orotidine 5'-phosphate decarboxylase n=1 Tax=Helicobacter enhydrae TaxID=222136 RepID=A0A1B1U5M6_9HELI|nr:orotidine-5'-phosphate decarboxylase [Helicobacter enhydrae]ANV97995.1 orotidine 5'-phosphate decarboxylase [Helicobacter enhydrae]